MHNLQFWFVDCSKFLLLFVYQNFFIFTCLFAQYPIFCIVFIVYFVQSCCCCLCTVFVLFIHSHTIKQNGHFSVYSIDTLGHKIRQCFFCCCWITQTAHFHATTNVFCYCCFKTQLNQNVSFFVCVLCTSVQYKAHLIYI